MLENLEYTDSTEENHKIEQLLTYYCVVLFSKLYLHVALCCTIYTDLWEKSRVLNGAGVEARDGKRAGFHSELDGVVELRLEPRGFQCAAVAALKGVRVKGRAATNPTSIPTPNPHQDPVSPYLRPL